jgi:hypothetical protein
MLKPHKPDNSCGGLMSTILTCYGFKNLARKYGNRSFILLLQYFSLNHTFNIVLSTPRVEHGASSSKEKLSIMLVPIQQSYAMNCWDGLGPNSKHITIDKNRDSFFLMPTPGLQTLVTDLVQISEFAFPKIGSNTFNPIYFFGGSKHGLRNRFALSIPK